eukprot:scaffold58791_cov62-Phaeocystis_antarctica.AAC.3
MTLQQLGSVAKRICCRKKASDCCRRRGDKQRYRPIKPCDCGSSVRYEYTVLNAASITVNASLASLTPDALSGCSLGARCRPTTLPECEVAVALPHRLGRAAHVQPKAVPRVA